MTPRISSNAITKRWADGSGLMPTTFSAQAGEIVVVRGRSGSGKSTLLGIVAGLCRPDAGSLLIDGVDHGDRLPLWDDLTFVPQGFALAVELTILENVLDVRPKLAADEIEQLMSDLGLDHLAGSPPDEVSMGERQRCAVARALVTRPPIVLADEPTSHQDLTHAGAVLRILRSAADRGTTVVIATHDAEIVAMASTVVDLEAAG